MRRPLTKRETEMSDRSTGTEGYMGIESGVVADEGTATDE